MSTTSTIPPSASAAVMPGSPVEVAIARVASAGSESASSESAPAPRPAMPWWRAAIPRHPLLWLSAFAIACGWDRVVWLALKPVVRPNMRAIEGVDVRGAIGSLFSWHALDAVAAVQYFGYHAIKLFGSMYIVGAIAAWLVIRPLFQPDVARVKSGLRRGVLLFLAPAAAGLAAEALKMVFRRQRPEFSDGLMSFRFHDFWSGSGLGLPSSHAAVAVGAAVAMSVLWPRWRTVWIALAVCCVVSRVLAGAHFVSDVVLGVLVGLCAARAMVQLDLNNNRGVPVGAIHH